MHYQTKSYFGAKCPRAHELSLLVRNTIRQTYRSLAWDYECRVCNAYKITALTVRSENARFNVARSSQQQCVTAKNTLFLSARSSSSCFSFFSVWSVHDFSSFFSRVSRAVFASLTSKSVLVHITDYTTIVFFGDYENNSSTKNNIFFDNFFYLVLMTWYVLKLLKVVNYFSYKDITY